jgi:hypothetical protein
MHHAKYLTMDMCYLDSTSGSQSGEDLRKKFTFIVRNLTSRNLTSRNLTWGV